MLFILSIASGYGGAERSIEIIMRHLPLGLPVRIYAEASEHIDQLSRPGCLPITATLLKVSTWTQNRRRIAAMRLVCDYERYRPTAILVNTNTSAIVAAMAAKIIPELGGVSHLYVRDFLWTHLGLIFSRLRGARVLVPSQAVLDRYGYLVPFYSKPYGPSECEIIPDMVDLPSDGITMKYTGPILHLATISPWKGHVFLMMAVYCLKAKGVTSIRVSSYGIVGDPFIKNSLASFIAQLHIDDCFFLGGYISDPTPYLRECRAVVVSSVSHSGGPETFCRAIIEAWAFRKPVVAFSAGAPAQLINHEVDGLLVPEGNYEALAAALQRLIESPDLCRKLGEAGYAKVAKSYQSSQVTHQLLDYLGRCLNSDKTHAI